MKIFNMFYNIIQKYLLTLRRFTEVITILTGKQV